MLSSILERVRADRTLCLGIRADYINVYYRGGNLLRVKRLGSQYGADFDPNYLANPDLLPRPHPTDIAAWISMIPILKDAMDRSGKLKIEREIQQSILRDNNFCSSASSSDYYICDIEYAISRGNFRFDIVGVRWPSDRASRKRDRGHRLVFGEVKQGDNALDGNSGLHDHIRDVNEHLADPKVVDATKAEMITVFNQKRALGLLDCKKDLVAFSDDPPLLVLVLVNHDPEKKRLRELLRSLPESPNAEVRIATSSLMGYGLYHHCVLTVEDALARFGDRIQ